MKGMILFLKRIRITFRIEIEPKLNFFGLTDEEYKRFEDHRDVTGSGDVGAWMIENKIPNRKKLL